MARIITIDLMTDQVKRSLEGNNLPETAATPIINDLVSRYGLRHIDTIPSQVYWTTVERHTAFYIPE